MYPVHTSHLSDWNTRHVPTRWLRRTGQYITLLSLITMTNWLLSSSYFSIRFSYFLSTFSCSSNKSSSIVYANLMNKLTHIKRIATSVASLMIVCIVICVPSARIVSPLKIWAAPLLWKYAHDLCGWLSGYNNVSIQQYAADEWPNLATNSPSNFSIVVRVAAWWVFEVDAKHVTEWCKLMICQMAIQRQPNVTHN